MYTCTTKQLPLKILQHVQLIPTIDSELILRSIQQQYILCPKSAMCKYSRSNKPSFPIPSIPTKQALSFEKPRLYIKIQDVQNIGKTLKRWAQLYTECSDTDLNHLGPRITYLKPYLVHSQP